ncbi:hypothetical protein [Streptomyces indicus]|uniref:Uncharacterized protein n=1 Tax=Streptomyces indicus TaxID=417292 RepID=A0A1G9ITD8_9ACTN|nr:hypothetical protein [Streptomyces indicus]SDL28054.1 hypothetical protein SAMN05421806_12540 [Streptomyces indicus]
MPLLSTLIDNFNDGVIGPEWGDSYGGVTETGGQARIPLVAGAYAGYQTGRAWTFAGATVYLKLATRPATSTGTDVSANFLIKSAVDGTALGFKYDAVTNVLRMHSMVDYYDPTGVEIPFDAVNHLWLRLREDGTNVYWDTSPNGTVWTNRRTLATPAWVPANIDTCALDLFAYRNAGVTDYAAYDNVNTLNDGAVWSAAAALTGETSLTSTVRLSARTNAALTADTTLTAGLALSAHAGADLTAEAVLDADAASTEIPEVAELSAGDWDLYIEQGSTFVQNYTVTDEGFTWAGWNARAQIRSAPASENGILLLDLTPYLTVIGAAIRCAVPASVTQTLERNGVWDLEVYQGNTVVRLLNGRAIVSREVTRS